MIKILHLSDLHFCADAQANNMKNILLNEARAVHDLPRGEKILVITGDYHNYYDVDYQFAEDFIGKLVDAMNIDPAEDVFIVPGNHDVGNDITLEHAGVDKKMIRLAKAASSKIREGDRSFIEDRLSVFTPYCVFAQRIGTYNDSDKMLPAKVHVRQWRDKLNILHLNTALVADGKTKDSQMADTNTATSDGTWKEYFRADFPTLALGHNSFYDLEVGQQMELKTMFFYRNVSAYLCGDTHLRNLEEQKQVIPLEYGMVANRLSIPNIVCVKGVSERGDTYSDFGYYWHGWDEDTNRVELQLQSWKPENLYKTFPDGMGGGHYDMRRKTNTGKKVGTDIETCTSEQTSSDELKSYLDDILRRTRKNHPSFVVLGKDEIDKRLFPNVAEMRQFEAKGKISDNAPVSPVWNIIRESWTSANKHNIVIMGEGGIGKTVTLFSVTNFKDNSTPPAVYVPMHRLVDESGHCINLSDYLESISKTHGKAINALAAGRWNDTPKLLVLLDGFNEVPGNKRRMILHMINDWYIANPGAQIIAVSRPMDGMNLGKELKGNPLTITLEPLSKETVVEYLGEKTPDESSRVWDVLTRPLFLNLFIKTDQLEGCTSDGYELAPKKAETGGALIWNYLQRELLREEDEKWVLRCAIACEYILPYIAYRMEKEHRFTTDRERLIELIDEAMSVIDVRSLPHHLSYIFEEYDNRHDDTPDLAVFDWKTTICKDIGLLKKVKGSYAFVHQNFRDALAGLYLVNQAETMKHGEPLPAVWRMVANHNVMDYSAQLMGVKEAEILWEVNRKTRPTDSYATFTMIELQKRRVDATRFEMDFSGMDIRGLNLARYLGGRDRKGIGRKLFRKDELSKQTKLDEEVFRSQGHTGSVNCIVSNVDGQCVSGSSDGTLRVWDMITGKSLHTLEDHKGWIGCVSLSGDGRCVSGSDDGTLRVWDMTTGKCLHILEGHKDWVRCVSLSGDGRCVSGSDDGTLRVWDMITGECLHTLEGHSGWIRCVSLSEDDRCVSGSFDGTLRVWNLVGGECLQTLKGHKDRVRCVSICGDGHCVSGSDDETLRVWDLTTGKCLNILEGHKSCVTCVWVSGDGQCVSGSDDRTLRVWDLTTGESLHILGGHEGCVSCVSISGGGQCVSGSDDGTLRVWDLATGECIHILEGHRNRVVCVSIIGDSQCVSGSSDGILRVWDLVTGECLYTLEGHKRYVNCISFSGDQCVSGSSDGTLRVWDMVAGKCLYTLEEQKGWVRFVLLSRDGKLCSVSDEGILQGWDLMAGKCLYTLENHIGWVRCVSLSEDGKCVIGSDDGTLRVWDLSTGGCLHTMKHQKGGVSCISISGDSQCVSGSSDGILWVWDLATGECLNTIIGHKGWVRCVSLIGNGQCASASDDGTLKVWDLTTGKCLNTQIFPQEYIRDLMTNKDGKCVSRCLGGFFVWDLATGEYLLRLEMNPDDIRCISISGDGQCVSVSNDGILRVLDLDTGECLDVLYPMEFDVSHMDFSEADFSQAKNPLLLEKTLWQNGAKIPGKDYEVILREHSERFRRFSSGKTLPFTVD